MTRSLGRCDPVGGRIRLAAWLADKDTHLLHEVLCHEAAHVAVQRLHGNSPNPHGREWKHLMRLAGYVPRATLPDKVLPESVRDRQQARRMAARSRQRRWLHRCVHCGAERGAARRYTGWRCRGCREQGLSGRIEILDQSVPGPHDAETPGPKKPGPGKPDPEKPGPARHSRGRQRKAR